MAARENYNRDKVRSVVERTLGVPSLLLELRHDRGWPDVLFLVPGGRPLLMELKRPGRDLEPLQVERRDTLLKLGYNAIGPVSSVTEAIFHVQGALAEAKTASIFVNQTPFFDRTPRDDS